ncbi:protoheme IX farnesyltransferase [Devosia chinhatensis]|uniref:Protoheme IX farnesyltransferase n=2 Tax=Devosia chinhatensis TaxID=429727 RepID=A0A0F5FNQ3_9HYPH|nr:heme o synthase [Devosia chinhatensis]KKB10185.1 protoheme IX farnesyltransferase [Devosia chinhatensis]
MTGGARVEDYLALLKPRVMSLVVFTAFVGMLVAPAAINPVIGFIAILCIAIGAGASGALNMWYDADIDQVMSRTQNRPIPAGRMTRGEALAFGLILSVFSVTLLGLATNWVAGAFLAFTIFFYAVVYTMWLKRSTPQNIVIGGAAGAFPPMVGWAAVTGTLSWESFALFLIIFLWTPPHFWALALYKQGDYGAAGIPMMPNVAGEASTKRQIFAYSLVLAASSVLPLALGFSGWLYGAVALVTGLIFVALAFRLLRAVETVTMKRHARALFTYSLSYLFVLFLALLIDHLALRLGVI